MKRIATPMIGGIVTSAILELLLYPIIYVLWKGRSLPRDGMALPGRPITPPRAGILTTS